MLHRNLYHSEQVRVWLVAFTVTLWEGSLVSACSGCWPWKLLDEYATTY